MTSLSFPGQKTHRFPVPDLLLTVTVLPENRDTMGHAPQNAFCQRFPVMPALRPKLCVLIALTTLLAQDLKADTSNPFGRQENSAGGLIGILYDFKQDQKRRSTGTRPEEFTKILGEFFQKGWSESVLNRYFRATRPLYATQIFIPEMGAEHAPRAFGLENVIRPSTWVVYYKGQVTPPEDGTYRFLAYADDLIAVAVNNRIVTLAGRPDTTKHLKMWSPSEQGPEVPAANGHLVFGDWVTLKKDEPIDLDILVGERPGGKFSAFLLYEKQGTPYPLDESGRPQYAVFQLAPADIPSAPAKLSTRFSVPEQIWTGIQ